MVSKLLEALNGEGRIVNDDEEDEGVWWILMEVKYSTTVKWPLKDAVISEKGVEESEGMVRVRKSKKD